ncbi:MAG: methylthioribulose 1-phosphate dehydratase [Pirellula sp.]
MSHNDPDLAPMLQPYASQIDGLRQVGQMLWTRGWSLGTSSNYSVVIDRSPLRILITASGKDKGHLGPNDFVIVDESGKATTPDQPKSSAETLLHCLAAANGGVGAVLHTHSVWSTLLSHHFFALGGIRIEGFEMLKGLEGITTHEASCWLPIFDNTQDIPALQLQVDRYMRDHPEEKCWGYLIRRHGLYTWGKDLSEATRHIEIIEFLLECIGRTLHR